MDLLHGFKIDAKQWSMPNLFEHLILLVEVVTVEVRDYASQPNRHTIQKTKGIIFLILWTQESLFGP